MSDQVVFLNNARIAWPHLFTPKTGTNDDGTPSTPKFSATLLIEKDNPAAQQLMAAARTVAKEKWKDKAERVLEMLAEDKRMCFSGKPKVTQDGEVREEFVGKVWISASNKIRPALVDLNPSIPLKEEDGKVYAGCYVNAKVALWAFDSPKYGRRICATLMGVQFVKDGDAFGGASENGAAGFANLAVESAAGGFADVSGDDIPF